MSLLDQLDSELRPFAQALFDIAKAAGVNPRVTSGVRSYARQKQLYEAWLRGDSKYPAAPPGHSAHEYGLAFDMVVDGTVNQSDCGVVWSSWNGVYGGEEDPIHFEHPKFKTLPRRPDPSGSVQEVPIYTPSKGTLRARQWADEHLSLIRDLLPEVEYINDIGQIAAAIVRALGGDASGSLSAAAAATLEWGFENPNQFLGAYGDAIRSWYLSKVF